MIPAMNVYILGLDHETQQRDGKASAVYHDEFEKLVRELITKHDITFIGDETYIEKKSIAREIADDLKIRWEPIEMTTEMREQLGIVCDQAERLVAIGNGWKEPIRFKETRVRSDSIREEYMFWKAATKAEEANAESILILCGFQHAGELQRIFQKDGHRVTLDSLCTRPWYTHPDCE
jgi:hypothetical protein